MNKTQMYKVDPEKVEKDTKRILKWYNTPNIKPYLTKNILKEIGVAFSYLEYITDLSEDYFREYFNNRQLNDMELDMLCHYQTGLSERFYEDFLDKFNSVCKIFLIKYERVSPEFIKKHSEAFNQEVWSVIYG